MSVCLMKSSDQQWIQLKSLVWQYAGYPTDMYGSTMCIFMCRIVLYLDNTNLMFTLKLKYFTDKWKNCSLCQSLHCIWTTPAWGSMFTLNLKYFIHKWKDHSLCQSLSIIVIQWQFTLPDSTRSASSSITSVTHLVDKSPARAVTRASSAAFISASASRTSCWTSATFKVQEISATSFKIYHTEFWTSPNTCNETRESLNHRPSLAKLKIHCNSIWSSM